MPPSDVKQAFLANNATQRGSSIQPGQTSMLSQTRFRVLAHRWTSSWQAPVTMIGLLILGGAMAVGHHTFYQSLNNTKTPDNFSQQLNTAYGTAFAFVAKACMIAAVGTAYMQYIWANFRRKLIKISTIDSTFTATTSIVSMLDPQFIWTCKTGAFLAALVWLLPLSAIVTPATLSVRPSTSSVTVDLTVPTLNFSIFVNLRDDHAVKAPLTRLSKLAISGVQIQSVQAFHANASYTVELMGPSLKCGTPSSDVAKNIDAIFEETGGQVMNINGTVQQKAVYVALTPFTPWTYGGRAWPLDDLGQVDTNSSDWSRFVDLCLKGSQSDCSLFGPTLYGIPDMSTIGYGKTIDTTNALWLRFDDDRMSCSVQKTRYRLEFDARNPHTVLKSYNYTQDGVFEGDSSEYQGLIVAIQPLLDILRGSTYMDASWCFQAEMQMTQCTSSLAYMVSQTSIHETALTAMVSQKAGEIRNRTWEVVQNQGIEQPLDAIPSADPRDIPLTRNLSLREIIEEMSHNLTLSYFSDARYLSPNNNNATVTTITPINIYHYNIRNLILVYAIAFGASAVAVGLGLYVYAANGFFNRTANFSAILFATIRNPGLGELIERSTTTVDTKHNSSSVSLGPDVLKIGLKYGTLFDDHISDIERRESEDIDSANVEAFGVPGQVL